MDILLTIGKRIRSLRKAAGMTQEELAEKADLHSTYIGQVERGEKNITVETLYKVTSALNISMAELFNCIPHDFKSPSFPELTFELVSNEDINTQKRLFEVLKEIVKIKDEK